MSNDNQSTRSERHNNNDNQQRNVGGLIKKILLWVADRKSTRLNSSHWS